MTNEQPTFSYDGKNISVTGIASEYQLLALIHHFSERRFAMPETGVPVHVGPMPKVGGYDAWQSEVDRIVAQDNMKRETRRQANMRRLHECPTCGAPCCCDVPRAYCVHCA